MKKNFINTRRFLPILLTQSVAPSVQLCLVTSIIKPCQRGQADSATVQSLYLLALSPSRALIRSKTARNERVNSCFRLEFFQVQLIRERLYHLGGTFIGSGTSAIVDGVCARGVPRSSIPKSRSKVSPSHSTVESVFHISVMLTFASDRSQ